MTLLLLRIVQPAAQHVHVKLTLREWDLDPLLVETPPYPSLSDWGRLRLEASATLKREMVKDFFVGLNGGGELRQQTLRRLTEQRLERVPVDRLELLNAAT